MKFTLELEPGATYATLARRLQSIAIQLALGENRKPEHPEEINIRECGEIVGRWSITK
jgi:hypothetical protein